MNHPPETTINEKPTNPSVSSVTFGYSSPDASATRYQCSLDAVLVPCPGTSAAGGQKSFTSLADGSHTFTVAALDGGGLADPTPATYSWVVDHALAPETTINEKPANPSGSRVTFGYFSPDDSAVGYRCTLDGDPIFCPGTDPTGGQTSFFVPFDGIHTFSVAAFDGTGLVDPTAASIAWIVDHTVEGPK